MYKMVIVDDELLVQVGIKSMLDWDKQEIQIVGMASNGEQAYELIEKEIPDIVITDVKMPVLDGLELMKRCKDKLSFWPQFILLSSFEEFDYAKKALKLGAVEYLVKLELSEESMLEAINIAKLNLTREAGYIKKDEVLYKAKPQEEKIFKQLINNAVDTEMIRELVSKINRKLCDNLYILCFNIQMKNTVDMIKSEEERIYDCVINTSTEIINKESLGYAVPIDRCNFFITVHNEESSSSLDLKEQIKDLMLRIIHVNSEYFNVSLQISCSKFHYSIEKIAQSYNEARRALTYLQIDNSYVFYEDIEEDVLQKRSFDVTIFTKQIGLSFKQGDEEEIRQEFTKLIELFSTVNPLFEQTLDCCYKLLYFVLTFLENGEDIIDETLNGTNSGFSYISNFKNLGEAMGWLRCLSEAICAEISSQNGDYSKRLVGRAKAIIEEHLSKKLTLNDVAEELGVSTGYLSLVFKKFNNVGFSDYVARNKIEYAMGILKEGRFKIYEVAESVGFENAYYFSKVFKKVVGITPKEYVARLN